ncbi:hypothetical protein RCH07_003834 [Arthrobacter sp. CG_A4]|nr:hypothetical protein [Arthrobacter sp. CG_A4]
MGIVDGRDHKGVGDWLFARPLHWRLGVQVVALYAKGAARVCKPGLSNTALESRMDSEVGSLLTAGASNPPCSSSEPTRGVRSSLHAAWVSATVPEQIVLSAEFRADRLALRAEVIRLQNVVKFGFSVSMIPVDCLSQVDFPTLQAMVMGGAREQDADQSRGGRGP